MTGDSDRHQALSSREESGGDSAATSGADRARLRSWTEDLLSEPWQLPVTFRYREVPVRGIPQEWSPTSRTRTAGPGRLETVVEGRDPETGLGVRVEILRYHGYPVVEWTAWLTNHASEPTPIIEDLLGLDASFTGGAASIQHSNGDFYSGEGYAWQSTSLPGPEPLRVAPHGGRPCDGAFPYFRLLFGADTSAGAEAGGAGGLSLAIGWPGQWSAEFAQHGNRVSIRAGQQQTRLRLSPGETVRTPRITLLGWDGEPERAVNLWRRWYREQVMPRPSGALLKPLLSMAATDDGEEFTGATEQNQVEYQRRCAAADLDYDVWWVDAGWYPCRDRNGERRWTATGSWTADPERFPDGLAPVAAASAENAAGLLLWFEPERVTPATELWDRHPEWVLRRPGVDYEDSTAAPHARSGLLDLSDDDCRRWLTDRVSTLITRYGIAVYRQDFNFPPLDYWRAHDGADRQGMTENLHVQGYLAFWDSLLERHPHLLIDSCASGGRRNDLETMRRSVPLHYTDYGYGEHATKLDFHHTMFEWLPYFRETTQSWDLDRAGESGLEAAENDSFSFHCALAPMLTPAVDIRQPDAGFGTVRTMSRIWRRAADLMLDADYYPLTPPSRTDKAWVAWQFDRPAELAGRGAPDGFVQAIRLAEAEQASLVVRPKGLRAEARYRLEEAETGERRELSGAELMRDGLCFELPRRRGSIWFYSETA